ncbi:MAG: HEAT repeat domain-containing protein [Deltaproteobacteria bacterium]|nr:HEAT repeat domain-containing protein [Deltaproteobacteria bacterium]
MLAAVVEHPSADVIDDAVRVLSLAGPAQRDLYAGLLEGAPIGLPGLSALRASPDVRLALARVLAALDGPLDRDEARALARAISDASEDVRDAAVTAIARRGGPELVAPLEERRNNEASDLVRASIDDAIVSLRSR